MIRVAKSMRRCREGALSDEVASWNSEFDAVAGSGRRRVRSRKTNITWGQPSMIAETGVKLARCKYAEDWRSRMGNINVRLRSAYEELLKEHRLEKVEQKLGDSDR